MTIRTNGQIIAGTSSGITEWGNITGTLSNQTDLDNALNAKADISSLTGFEQTSNKVTSISSSSTDTQYPSAKCVYDIIGNIETLINAL